MKAAVIRLVVGDAPETPNDYIAALYVDDQGRLCIKDSAGAVSTNFTGSGVCEEGLTETTVEDERVAADAKVFLQARDEDFVALGAFISSVAAGAFTITHGEAAGTEAFDYLVIT
jgi:hypothetical protein